MRMELLLKANDIDRWVFEEVSTNQGIASFLKKDTKVQTLIVEHLSDLVNHE